MWFLILNLLFVFTQSTFIWNSNLNKCLTSIDAFNCEHYGFQTITNNEICEKSTDSYLGRIIIPTTVATSEQWANPPGCFYDNTRSYFNKREKSYYDSSGMFSAAEGHCKVYKRCICQTELNSCPEEVDSSNMTSVSEESNTDLNGTMDFNGTTGFNGTMGFNGTTGFNETTDSNKTNILQSSFFRGKKMLTHRLWNYKSGTKNINEHACPNDQQWFLTHVVNNKRYGWTYQDGSWLKRWIDAGSFYHWESACTRNWGQTRMQIWITDNVFKESGPSPSFIYRKRSDLEPETIFHWLTPNTDITQKVTACTTPVTLSWWPTNPTWTWKPWWYSHFYWYWWMKWKNDSTHLDFCETEHLTIANHLNNLLTRDKKSPLEYHDSSLINIVTGNNKVSFQNKIWGTDKTTPNWGNWNKVKYTGTNNPSLITKFIKKIAHQSMKPLDTGTFCTKRDWTRPFDWKGIVTQTYNVNRITGFDISKCKCKNGEIKNVGDETACNDNIIKPCLPQYFNPYYPNKYPDNVGNINVFLHGHSCMCGDTEIIFKDNQPVETDEDCYEENTRTPYVGTCKQWTYPKACINDGSTSIVVNYFRYGEGMGLLKESTLSSANMRPTDGGIGKKFFPICKRWHSLTQSCWCDNVLYTRNQVCDTVHKRMCNMCIIQ